MKQFAAVILACNEQECLPRCLDSIADVAELYLSVDEASTDQTEALARQYGAHVSAHNLAAAEGGWAQVRNALQDEAEQLSEQQWFLWIDPDEWLVVDPARRGRFATLFRNAEAAGGTGLMVRMVDIPVGAEPGMRGATWQNCKFFKRGQRFARRRHEHLPAGERRGVTNEVAIHHQKLQRPEVQSECLALKTNLQALRADWAEWNDMRAAYYLGDAFLQAGDAPTALLWFERGLGLPDTILGARSQLYAGLYGAHRALGNTDAARHATHGRWACDWRDSRDCAWQLGSLAVDTGDLEAAEHWFKTVLTMPEAKPGMNQVLSSSPVELAHFGLAVVMARTGKLTELQHHLRAAEQFGTKPEYAALREQFVKVVSASG